MIRRFPVTTGEYLGFLNDLVAKGGEAEAIAACPRAHEGSDNAGEPVFHREGRGLFVLPEDPDRICSRLDRPIVLVDWHAATAYARWLAERTDRAWRLPNELEREKATRGVDGRLLPWGDHVEPTFACVGGASAAAPALEAVTDRPFDESPYGIRGLAGNTRDWCINVWKQDGPLIEGGQLRIDAAAPDDPDFRVIKGGTWTAMMISGRGAARFGGRPGIRRQSVGIRVTRSLDHPKVL